MKNNNPRKQFFKGDNEGTPSNKSDKRGDSKGRTRKSDVKDEGFDLAKSSFSKPNKRGASGSYDKNSKGSRSGGEKKFGSRFPKEEEKGNDRKSGFQGKSSRFQKDENAPKRFGEKSFEKRGKSGKFGSKDENDGLVYKGRGKDQKPVFAPGKAKKYDGKPKSAGFGKNRFKSNSEAQNDRPDYKFDELPARKAKGKGEDTLFRLNKYIANSGICSRREADDLIAKGLVSVNGKVVTELGLKVSKFDRVVYQGKKINPEKPVYVLLNKPKDFITTTDDPLERKTVMALVGNACEERIFPVGRLDRNTTGLLLFTNDGELAAKLSHPSNQIKKIYQVTLDKPLTHNDEKDILEGLTLEDGEVEVDDMQVLSVDRKILGLEIHVGKNRIVRRIFAHLGYEVTALDRVMYAGLDKKDLKRGNYRFLSEQEVIKLKYFA